MTDPATRPPASGEGQPAFIDLHTHSTASDGSRAPADVARAAKAAGLVAVALTDHDTLDGLPAARAAASALGIRLVEGIELSAVEDDVETHVLGLHLGETSELSHRLIAVREMRVSRAQRMVERLNALGIPVTFDAVMRESAGGAVGRPHVARALIAGGWVTDFREAFEKYLGNGKQAFIAKDKLSLRDAIALIHRAGGIAVLAHPGSSCTRDRVATLVEAGLDGLEVLHPSHSPEDSRRLEGFVNELGLVRSGGSDWHGATDGARSLGMMRVPAPWLADHDARVAARRSRRVA